MKRPAVWISAFAGIVIGGMSAAQATPYDAEDDIRGHLPNRTYEVYLSGGHERALAAAMADHEFATAMRKHHQGAVTMSQGYLADARGTHPILRQLARGIIANQKFEIAVLSDVLGRIAQPPRQVGFLWLRETGLTGAEHRVRFSKAPPPSGVDLVRERQPLSEFDVTFIKAMTVHHQAAVDMARAYNRNPVADNPVIRAMNRDIIIDQNYEIAFLQRLIGRYPGDPNAVAVDPGMIHGMPGESTAMAPQSPAPHAGAH